VNNSLAKKLPPSSEPRRESIEDAIKRTIRDELQSSNFRQKRMLSIEEAAEYLGSSTGTVHNLISEGKLTPSRYTRRPMLDIEDLDTLIRASKQAG
jgi:excisionase family DNA binding protein